ncbi:hypothetical protein THRCLA_21637 [Thraustotheca clavata]|uniref:HTH myb-type domain-containing protein n=1 Tax=Thraustotheca clavata TaxID=74557 RepID=A0A1V9ZSX9_9STRA|nr:hypothetical protein THRCLA_21637 [Thraustotheca clavata]
MSSATSSSHDSTSSDQGQPSSVSSSSNKVKSESSPEESVKSEAKCPPSMCYGPWSADEHERFLLGLQLYPEGPWKAVADVVKTRSAKQAQTHMQKCKEKIVRQQRRQDEAIREAINDTHDENIRAAALSATHSRMLLQRSKHAENLRIQTLEPIPFDTPTPFSIVASAMSDDDIPTISWTEAVDYFWMLLTSSEEVYDEWANNSTCCYATTSPDTDDDMMDERPQVFQRQPRPSNTNKNTIAYGPWSPEEHERFLLGIQLYPEGPWKDVADVIKTRNAKQAQTHMQKCKEKILRQRRRRDEALRDVMVDARSDAIRLVAQSATSAPILLQRSKHADNLRLPALEPNPLDATPLEAVTSALLVNENQKITWTEAVDYFWSLVSVRDDSNVK